jgi:acyl dehydratase
MAIAQDIIGTHYRYDDHFVVGREKVREFANAIKDDHPAHHDVQAALDAGHPGIVAPLTFIAVAGRRVQLEMFKQFDVGINLERVIHRDQKLKFHRPIVTGDHLYFETFLDSVIQSHGTVIAELRSEVTDAAGGPVLTTVVTMIGEAISDEHTDAQVAAIASRIGGE